MGGIEDCTKLLAMKDMISSSKPEVPKMAHAEDNGCANPTKIY